jgi:glycosyltransferase involved in cell wall biosynthesis
MLDRKKNILVFSDFYLPGYKAGGQLRSIANLAEQLGGEFSFKIVTRDRDLGDVRPYVGVICDSWQRQGQAEVYYCSPKNMSMSALQTIINATDHDVFYLNSFFSLQFTIKPLLLRRLGLIPSKQIILAPRGEFSPGAMALKSIKKRAYISLAKFFRFYEDVTWQASSQHEKADILQFYFREHAIGKSSSVIIAPDMPGSPLVGERGRLTCKTFGQLKVLFLSRISPKKNLYGALVMLHGLRGRVTFDIYGPIEDQNYWEKCTEIIDTLPDNIKVRYLGVLPNERVVEVMAEYDLFFFPTLGENFGHVILEAFVAGCPVLISDQTPWRGLEAKGIGWDLSLDSPDLFMAALHECLRMDDASWRAVSLRAQKYALEKIQDQDVVEQNRQLFAGCCHAS